MLQAIKVTYSADFYRFRASAAGGYCYFDMDDRINHANNAAQAARKLANRLKWRGSFFGGRLKDGAYVFVQVDNNEFAPNFIVA